MAGIYLHIPFCKQACHYCDFHFSTNLDLKKELCHALVQEISLQKSYLEHEEITTVYFGGGTPSLLSEKELAEIIEAIYSVHSVSKNAEVTLEANPDDLSTEKIKMLSLSGINRLSIGIQSFDNSVLRTLNRVHSAEEAKKSVLASQDAGINNINIDLIYAIPGQDEVMLRENIQQALSLNPSHISSYSLTIEEKTVFGKWTKSGKFHAVGDDFAARQFEIMMDALTQAGFEHYEISNYALPGFYSIHNTSYWQQKKYLGIGPSAHSFNHISRQHNVANNSLYIKSIHAGTVPFEKELLTRENRINEYLFTTLRTQWGTDLNFLKNQFNFDLLQELRQTLLKLLEQNLITVENNTMMLTRTGKLFADQVASDLFV